MQFAIPIKQVCCNLNYLRIFVVSQEEFRYNRLEKHNNLHKILKTNKIWLII